MAYPSFFFFLTAVFAYKPGWFVFALLLAHHSLLHQVTTTTPKYTANIYPYPFFCGFSLEHNLQHMVIPTKQSKNKQTNKQHHPTKMIIKKLVPQQEHKILCNNHHYNK